jgi:hypothetical protein
MAAAAHRSDHKNNLAFTMILIYMYESAQMNRGVKGYFMAMGVGVRIAVFPMELPCCAVDNLRMLCGNKRASNVAQPDSLSGSEGERKWSQRKLLLTGTMGITFRPATLIAPTLK